MKILKPALCAALVAMVCSISTNASAQVIVNDSFADGDRSITGSSGSDVEAAFFVSTNSNGIEDSVGVLGMVTGPSGRGIHGVFANQTLANIGDSLIFSYDFETPASIEAGGESSSFRIGLFDTNGADYALDITSSTDTIHENLTGIMMDHDVNTGAADLNFRLRNTTGTRDRLLSSTSQYTDLSGSGPDGEYELQVSSLYSGSITIERIDATDLMITGTISGPGGTMNGTTYSTTYTADTFNINMLAFHANSDNFGTSNTPDTADNGLDFTNVSVEFVSAAIPEPSSAILLLSGLFSLGVMRRRS